jgi:hypothetical protein
MGVPRTLARGLSKLKEAAELRKLGGTQAERMARAAEQGYDTSRVFYHGTGADVTEFDPLKMGKTDDGWFSKGFYFSPDAKVANQYAADGTPNVMPVYLRAENPYDWRKEVGQGMRFGTMDERYAKTREIMGSGHDSVDVYDEIVQLGDGEKLSDDVWQAIVARSLEMGNPVLPRDLVENGLRQGMTSKGEFARYYGDELANKMPLTRTLRERVVFDPSQVRSVNADFNPEYKDSSNLLAGIAGVMPYAGATAALLAGATGSQEAEAGPLQTLGRATPYLTSAALGGAAALQSGDAEAGGMPEYEQRLSQIPYPNIDNGDGSRSTHEMAVEADDNGNWFAFPTIQPGDNGQLQRFELRDAQQRAMATGNYKAFGQDKDAALRYGEGGYKVGTNIEPPPQPVDMRQYMQDALEARTAADRFAQMRGSKSGYWEARRQELLDMVNGLGEMANNVVLPALDKPLQGYLGLTGAMGALASGQGFEQALMQGANMARQPSDQTTYQLGGTVTDTLSPYVPDEAAAAAGTLVHTGLLMGSPL